MTGYTHNLCFVPFIYKSVVQILRTRLCKDQYSFLTLLTVLKVDYHLIDFIGFGLTFLVRLVSGVVDTLGVEIHYRLIVVGNSDVRNSVHWLAILVSPAYLLPHLIGYSQSLS
ncbi:hypothetical protein MUP37_07735 [Candidatus Bathyarchaeota archaeon]|nr:hypothetical protein [Candidatus Bathyarchaeota archaeon]